MKKKIRLAENQLNILIRQALNEELGKDEGKELYDKIAALQGPYYMHLCEVYNDNTVCLICGEFCGWSWNDYGFALSCRGMGLLGFNYIEMAALLNGETVFQDGDKVCYICFLLPYNEWPIGKKKFESAEAEKYIKKLYK